MKLLLLPDIYYEVLTENITGLTKSRFFISANPLTSRENALTTFLALQFDEYNADQLLVTVYMRYLKTGLRVELINSSTYETPGENLRALEQEVLIYRKQKIAANVGVFNSDHPTHITILWASNNYLSIKPPNVHLLLAQNYWLFLRKKKEVYKVA